MTHAHHQLASSKVSQGPCGQPEPRKFSSDCLAGTYWKDGVLRMI